MGLIESTPVPISQHEEEFLKLLDLYIQKSPMKILEIGTWEGGTLYHWVKNAPDGANIIAIDNQHNNINLYAEWESHDGHPRVFIWPLKEDSKSEHAIDLAKRFSLFDFIFIDGDHSYEGVKSDWNNYSPLINKSGIIAFHDILTKPPYNGQPIEVNKLWEEIKKEYKTEEIISNPGDGIGVVYF